MTKGKRKRLRQGQPVASRPRTPAGDPGRGRQPARPRPGRSPAREARAGTTRPPARTTRRTEDAVTAPQVQQPPVTVSLVRGLATVGRSPLMLAVVFGGALA